MDDLNPDKKLTRAEKSRINKQRYKKGLPTLGTLDSEDYQVALQKVAKRSVMTTEGKRERQKSLTEYLLSDDNSALVMAKWRQIIVNDEHPSQGMLVKAAIDRMLPLSMFEEKKDGARTQISINITGLNEKDVEGEIIDG